MRYWWAVVGLAFASALNASPLPDEAYEQRLTAEDRGRLMRMMYEYFRSHPSETQRISREQDELSRQLQSELYSSSPGLAMIERLDTRLKELKRQLSAALDRSSGGFYRQLSSEDRLKMMKMNYPLPPTIVIKPTNEAVKPSH